MNPEISASQRSLKNVLYLLEGQGSGAEEKKINPAPALGESTRLFNRGALGHIV
jgi:hypothetical protein